MEITLSLDVPALKDGDVRMMYDRLHDEMQARRFLPPALPKDHDVRRFTDAELGSTLKLVLGEMLARGMQIPLPPSPALVKMPAMDSAEEALVKVGNKIGAIKHYRDRVNRETGITPGLKDSKDVIDVYTASLPKDLLDKFGPRSSGSPNW